MFDKLFLGECNNYDSGLTLSLALWGRCKLLIALHEYSLALTDVQQALKEHLPTVFKAEAYWKMAICYKALKEDKKSKVAFDLAEKMLESNERIEELKKDREMIIQYLEKKDIKSMSSNLLEQVICQNKSVVFTKIITTNIILFFRSSNIG